MVKGKKADVEFSIGGNLELLKVAVAQARKELKKLGKIPMEKGILMPINKQKEALNKLAAVSKKTRLAQERLAKSEAFKKGDIQFQGWAMSLMFFGMAMQRVFTQIWKSSTKVFNDVMHSVEGTVTKFDMLNGQITYLKFVAGEALEPLVEYITPFIIKLTEWINNNQKLFRGLLAIVGVMGTLFFFIGTLVLGIVGLVMAFMKLGGWIAGLKGALTGLGAIIGTSIGAALAIVTGIIAALIILWVTDFAGFRDFVKAAFKNTWEYIKSIARFIINIFSGLWKVVKGVFTGDFDLMWEGLKQIVVAFIDFVIDIFNFLKVTLYNVFAFIYNVIKDWFINLILIIQQGVLRLIGLMNRIPGINISTKGADMAIDALKKIKEVTALDYKTFARSDIGGEKAITDNRNYEINITQKEGEDSESLWQRLLDKIKEYE